MIEYTLKELESETINSLIDKNERFFLSIGEEDSAEEERTKDVIDKIALLRAKRGCGDVN